MGTPFVTPTVSAYRGPTQGSITLNTKHPDSINIYASLCTYNSVCILRHLIQGSLYREHVDSLLFTGHYKDNKFFQPKQLIQISLKLSCVQKCALKQLNANKRKTSGMKFQVVIWESIITKRSNDYKNQVSLLYLHLCSLLCSNILPESQTRRTFLHLSLIQQVQGFTMFAFSKNQAHSSNLRNHE